MIAERAPAPAERPPVASSPAAPSYGVFEALGYLHAPADSAGECRIVEAGPDWRFDPGAFLGASSAVWGRPAAHRESFGRLTRLAAGRELAIARVRTAGRGGLGIWSVQRLPPIERPGTLRAAVRFALMSGALVRLGRGRERPRVVEAAARAAGHRTGRPLDIRPSGDGSVLARIDTVAGLLELRAARVGGLKDPRRAAEALRALEQARVPRVPRLVTAGETAGARWSAETTLDGRPTRRLTAGLAGAAIGFCASLPADGGPVRSLADRLAAIGAAFPRWAPTLDDARADLEPVACATPGILQHGDLWLGNLLADGGYLTGVIDWDTWHPAGMPGSDLLHLLGMAERSRTGLDLGELWLREPWARPGFVRRTREYWRAVGVEPRPDVLYAAAIDWWAGQLAAALRRGRGLVREPGWVGRNVDAVASAIAARTRGWQR